MRPFASAKERFLGDEDTPTMKRLNETAKTNEIPKAPSDIGISLDDTNTK